MTATRMSNRHCGRGSPWRPRSRLLSNWWRAILMDLIIPSFYCCLIMPRSVLMDDNETVFARTKLPVSSQVPAFDRIKDNITVAAGQTAILPCSINSLGRHKVIWIYKETSTLLTLQEKGYTEDERFEVDHSYITEWNLVIKDVRESDAGEYACQVNTEPPKYKLIRLIVLVAPRIIEDESTPQLPPIIEGANISLTCVAEGVPPPTIRWYRKTKDSITNQDLAVEGETIVVYNVTRDCAEFFECVASNKVPPAVSRQIKITVQFPPEIHMTNKKIGQAVGKETILTCVVTAYPTPAVFWEKDGHTLESDHRYQVEPFPDGDYTITVNLRIKSLEPSDYGKYDCKAYNTQGSDEDNMDLYEFREPSTPGIKPTHAGSASTRSTATPKARSQTPSGTQSVSHATHARTSPTPATNAEKVSSSSVRLGAASFVYVSLASIFWTLRSFVT